MANKDAENVLLAGKSFLKGLRAHCKRERVALDQRRVRSFEKLITETKKAPEVVLGDAVAGAVDEYLKLEDGELHRMASLGAELLTKPMFKQTCYSYSVPFQSTHGRAIKHIRVYVDIEKMRGIHVWMIDFPDMENLPSVKKRSGLFDFTLKSEERNGLNVITLCKTVDEHGQEVKCSDGDPAIASAYSHYHLTYGEACYEAYLDDMADEYTQRILHDFSGIGLALAWLHVNDYFPFSVEDANRYRKYLAKHGNDPSVTKVVFLNKLPEPKGPQKYAVRSSGSKSGHQRKGYWVTLKADRFKDHPMYLVHKGVYRQPAWVGPTSTEYEGNIYKVLLPGENMSQKLK